MNAVAVMLIAWGALILTHWANGKPAISRQQVLEMTFAVIFIAVLAGIPAAEPVAKGFAWLFLAAVLLRNDSILTALAKRSGASTPKGA